MGNIRFASPRLVSTRFAWVRFTAAGWCLAAALALPWTAAAAGSPTPQTSAPAEITAEAEVIVNAGEARFKVTADILNVRAAPSLEAPVIGRLKQGAVVEKLGEEDVWYRIRLGRLTGWVHSDYLAPVHGGSGASGDESASGSGDAGGAAEEGAEADTDGGEKPDANAGTRPAGAGRTDAGGPADDAGSAGRGAKEDGAAGGGSTDAAQPADSAQPKPRVIGRGIRVAPGPREADAGEAEDAARTGHVLGDAVRIRSGPGLDYSIEGRLNRGDRVTVTGSTGEWYSIVTEDGRAGWVAAAYIVLRKAGEEGTAESPLLGKTIVVDPGHGGNDSGAIGTTHGTWEKTLNLSTAVHLKRELELRGAIVVMTRVTDEEKPSLKDRVAIAERSGGDAFVSLHHNSAAGPASGILTFYYSGAKDKPLAAAIERRLAEADLGLESQGLSFGNFHVLRENSLPAVLLELGFLTNPHDEELARTEAYQSAAARAIVLGLEDYFASSGDGA